jgi:ribosomal protein L10
MTNQPRPHRRSRAAKQREVETLVDLLARARLLVLLQFEGVNAPKTAQLRNVVHAAGGRYRVVKNTLARRALLELGSPLAELPRGSSALLWCEAEPLRGWAEFDRYLSREFPQLIRRERGGPKSTQEGMDGKSAYRNHPFRTMVNELHVVAACLDGELVEPEQLAELVAVGGEAGVRAALLSLLSTPAGHLLATMQAPAHACLAVLHARMHVLARAPEPDG